MNDNQSSQNQGHAISGSSDSAPLTESKKENQESIAINSQPGKDSQESEKAPDVLAFRETIRRGWDYIKTDDFQGPATAISTIFIALFTFTTWIVILTGSGDTKKAATAASDFATTAGQIHTDLQQAVVETKTALSDSNVAMGNALAENRTELAKTLGQNRQSLQSSITQSKAVLDAAIASSELDQRAWVSSDVREINGNFTVGMKNTGKTPALKATQVTAFGGGKATAPPEVTLDVDSNNPFPPNTPPDFLERLRQEGYIPKTPPTGYVIAPNATQSNSDYQGKFSQIFKIAGDRAYIQGKITYDDVFGKHHQTLFCYWFAPPSDFVMCNTHNEMN